MVRERKFKYVEVLDEGRLTGVVVLRSNRQVLAKFHVIPEAGNIRNSELIQNQAKLFENYIKGILEPRL